MSEVTIILQWGIKYSREEKFGDEGRLFTFGKIDGIKGKKLWLACLAGWLAWRGGKFFFAREQELNPEQVLKARRFFVCLFVVWC